MAKSFTRAEFLQLVWSKPRLALAKEFGVSAPALAKLCLKARIPTPTVGYWSKVSGGRRTAVGELPLRLPGQSDRVVVGSQGYWRWQTDVDLAREPIRPVFNEDLEAQVASAVKRIGKVVASRDLAVPDRSLAQILECEAKRRAKYEKDRWDWNKPRFDDPKSQRHLRIFNGLARALSPLYGPQSVREEDFWVQGRGTTHNLVLHLSFGGAWMRLRIHEPGEPLRDKFSKPVTVATLRAFDGTDGATFEWADQEGAKLESRLTSIVHEILVRAETSLRQQEQRGYEEECDRRLEAIAAHERSLAEAERKRLEAIEVNKAKVRAEVIELARRRQVAQEIRSTVAALRSHPEVASDEGCHRFDRWATNALAVADDMDPFSLGLERILGSFEAPVKDLSS